MAAITVIDDHWPLVLVIYSGEPTSIDLEEYHEGLHSIYERGDRFGVLTDLTRVIPPPRKVRMEELPRIKAEHERARKQLIASSVIIESDLVRAIVGGILYLERPPAPYKVSSNVGEGYDWMEQMFLHSELGSMPLSRDWCLELIEKAHLPLRTLNQ